MQISTEIQDALAGCDLLAPAPTPLYMDNSQYEAWQSCVMRGTYAHACKRVPARGRDALDFGTLWHHAMEHRTHGATLAEQRNAVRTLAAEMQYAPPAEDRRSVARLETMIVDYDAEWLLKTEPRVLSCEGKPMIECTYTVPLCNVHGRPVFQTGKIDQVVEWEGRTWVLDFKTTSVMGERFADTHIRSSQMLGYVNAARTLLEPFGLPAPHGVLIIAACTRAQANEFALFPIPIHDWQVEEWREEFRVNLTAVVDDAYAALQTGHCTATRHHCVHKYGRCAYFDVCQLPPAARMRMLNDETEFVENTWDPLADPHGTA